MAARRIYRARFYLLVTQRRGRALVELVTSETARLLRALVWTQYQPSVSDRWLDFEPGDFEHTITGQEALTWLMNPDNRYRRLVATHLPKQVKTLPPGLVLVTELN